jgi:bifunctional non-homologous end joining protein LigD
MATHGEIVLYFREDTSDKEYRLQLLSVSGQGWYVAFQNGRRGSANAGGYKTKDAAHTGHIVSETQARRKFESVIREKVREGYTTQMSGNPFSVTVEEAIASAYGTVHHIDGDTSNNARENIAVVPDLHNVYQGDPVMREAEEQAGLHFAPRQAVPDSEELEEVVSTRRILWSGRPKDAQPQTPQAPAGSLQTSLLPQQPNPMSEDNVDRFLTNNDWGMQDKYDGKHVSVRVVGGQGQAFNKKGEPTVIPQTVMDSILEAGSDMEVDGELIGQRYVAYDLLSFGNTGDLRGRNYKFRYDCLTMVQGWSVEIAPLYTDTQAKRDRFNYLEVVDADGEAHGEGVVFKRLNARFTVGRPAAGGDMLKHKFWATCSCIVAPSDRDGKRSVALILRAPDPHGGQVCVPVGNVTISNKKVDGRLIEIPPIGSIVEIRYLYSYRGGSLYQPTYIGPRDDVSADECLMSQLKYKAED